jgi:hypothetical protein
MIKTVATRFIFSAALLCSCQKIVQLNLKTATPQLVIQGEVTNAPGPYAVSISRSVGFYADNNFPPVSGASVTISDNTGVTDSLTEVTPGVYMTHTLQGVPGNTYSLSVTTGDSIYSSVSTMPQPVPLDSVTFRTMNGFGLSQITAIVNFQDPADVMNYYEFIEYINGVEFTKEIFVFDDRLSSGKYISYGLRMDSAYLQKNDLLEVQMNCIDQNVYNYFNQLELSSGTGAFNTAASPANPSSNISNGAFGYFSANTTQSMTVTVP